MCRTFLAIGSSNDPIQLGVCRFSAAPAGLAPAERRIDHYWPASSRCSPFFPCFRRSARGPGGGYTGKMAKGLGEAAFLVANPPLRWGKPSGGGIALSTKSTDRLRVGLRWRFAAQNFPNRQSHPPTPTTMLRIMPGDGRLTAKRKPQVLAGHEVAARFRFRGGLSLSIGSRCGRVFFQNSTFSPSAEDHARQGVGAAAPVAARQSLQNYRGCLLTRVYNYG